MGGEGRKPAGSSEAAGTVAPPSPRPTAPSANPPPGVSISSDPTDGPPPRRPAADLPPDGAAVRAEDPAVPPAGQHIAAGGDGLPQAGLPTTQDDGVASLAGLHDQPLDDQLRRSVAQPTADLSAAEDGAAGEDGELGAPGAVNLAAKIRAVLRVRDFRKLWLSMSLSSFGDWMGLLAITATATSLVDSFAGKNYALGAVLLFRLLPAIVFGPLAGAFADRFDRRKTMVVSDVLRFGLFASIPLVGDLLWLFIAQFLIEAISLFWIPAKDAAVPNMLRKDQMEPANQLSLVTT
ncbi:MAG: tmk, partial [Modestobacter sp.]|nr:tmk [Modestobacter sp.]